MLENSVITFFREKIFVIVDFFSPDLWKPGLFHKPIRRAGTGFENQTVIGRINLKFSVMPDNKNESRPRDSARININEEYEVSYWTGKFNCSREELKDAVDSVGTSAANVEEYLKMATGKKAR
jgi:hypothetical protein